MNKSLEVNPSVNKLSWFWNILFGNKKAYLNTALASLFTNLFVLVIPLFLMSVYDRVLPNQAFSTLWTLALGAFIFMTFDFILRFFSNSTIHHISAEADQIISSKMFEHLLSLRMENKPESIGAVANYFKEFEILKDFFNAAVLVGLVDIPFVLLFLIAIAWIGGSIVFVSLFFVILVFVLSVLVEIPTRKFLHSSAQDMTDKQALLVETIWGLEAIKAMTAEAKIQKQWDDSSKQFAAAHSKIQSWLIFSSGLMAWIQQIGIISVVIYGAYLISDNHLSIGGLIAVSLLNSRVLILGQVTYLLSRISRTKDILKNVDQLMNLPKEVHPQKKLLKPEKIKGNIEFQKIHFSYPNQPLPALENINLKISAGEKVAIIGRIGSGKSTLLKLIAGFYQARSGLVLLDGLHIAEMDPAYIRRHVFYMSPQNAVFTGTLRDNLLIAKPEATDQELIDAVTLAGISEFVHHHPLGFDMELVERGENLSVGQRQSIVLARVFLRKPQVLLMDEPTSGIDNRLEKNFVEQLKQHFELQTIILVTHRSALLDLVERVIVLDGGKITADGPKDYVLNLLKNKT